MSNTFSENCLNKSPKALLTRSSGLNIKIDLYWISL